MSSANWMSSLVITSHSISEYHTVYGFKAYNKVMLVKPEDTPESRTTRGRHTADQRKAACLSAKDEAVHCTGPWQSTRMYRNTKRSLHCCEY